MRRPAAKRVGRCFLPGRFSADFRRRQSPGGGRLVLRLRRSWEPPDQDLDTFAVQVVIQG